MTFIIPLFNFVFSPKLIDFVSEVVLLFTTILLDNKQEPVHQTTSYWALWSM